MKKEQCKKVAVCFSNRNSKVTLIWLFWSYQLNNTANLAYSPRKWAKWAELAVLFSWQLQLPWVPTIHLSLFLLSIECPNFSCI